MAETRLSTWWARTEERLRAGVADSAARHPRLAGFLRTVVRYRLWIVGAAALTMAIVDGRGSFEIQDPQLFIEAGKKLFSDDALNVFADETVQEGPLGLLFWGVIGQISELVNIDSRMIAALVIYLGFTFAIVFLIRSALAERNRPSEDLEFFAAAIVLFGGLAWTMLSTGHIAEGVIPLLWFQAARDARHGRLDRSGLLIALSAGLKLWGILGIPILLLSSTFDRRKLLRAGAITVGVAAAIWLPFALLGEFNSLDYRWPIADSSLIHKFFPDSETFTWQMRVAQSGIVVVLGSAFAVLGRGRLYVLWAVPLGVVAVKLLFDPIVFSYYSLSIALWVLFLTVLLLEGWLTWVRILAGVAFSLTLYPTWFLRGVPGEILALAISTAAVLGVLAPTEADDV